MEHDKNQFLLPSPRVASAGARHLRHWGHCTCAICPKALEQNASGLIMTNGTHHCGVGLQCYTWASSITAGNRLMASNRIYRRLMTFWIRKKLRKDTVQEKKTKQTFFVKVSRSCLEPSSMLKSKSKGNFICTAATDSGLRSPVVCLSSLCVLWVPPVVPKACVWGELGNPDWSQCECQCSTAPAKNYRCPVAGVLRFTALLTKSVREWRDEMPPSPPGEAKHCHSAFPFKCKCHLSWREQLLRLHSGSNLHSGFSVFCVCVDGFHNYNETNWFHNACAYWRWFSWEWEGLGPLMRIIRISRSKFRGQPGCIAGPALMKGAEAFMRKILSVETKSCCN